MHKKMMVLLVLSLLLAFSGTTVNAGETLIIQIWPGTFEDIYREYVINPFEEKYGVEVLTTTGVEWFTLPKIAQEVQTGRPEVDIVQVTGSDFLRGREMGLWEELDFSRIPEAGNIFETYVYDHGIGFEIYQMGWLYNTNSDNHPPTEIEDIWKYDYDITIGQTHEQYLIPMINHMLTGQFTPVDIDLVFEKLDELKPKIVNLNASHSEVRTLLANNEVDISEAFNSRLGLMVDDGLPVEFLQSDSNYVGVDFWGVVKGTSNKELAEKFINFTLEAEQQYQNAVNQYLGPTNVNVVLGQELVEERGIPYGAFMENAMDMDDLEYIAQHLSQWTERWTRWMAGF